MIALGNPAQFLGDETPPRLILDIAVHKFPAFVLVNLSGPGHNLHVPSKRHGSGVLLETTYGPQEGVDRNKNPLAANALLHAAPLTCR